LAIKVDLRAPTVAQDVRIWRMFPGRGYQFLASFLTQQVGFLDIPDFVPPDQLSPKSNLIPNIARSQDVREAYYKYGPGFKPNAIKLADYAKSRRTPNRTRLEQALLTLLFEARSGDYVVLPEPVYRANIHVGRVNSNQGATGYYERR